MTLTKGKVIVDFRADSHSCLSRKIVWKLAIKKKPSYSEGKSTVPSFKILASKPEIIVILMPDDIILSISSRYLGIQSDDFLTCSVMAKVFKFISSA